MSPLRKVADCRKWVILDEIFYSRNSVMPEHANELSHRHQWIEKMENIAKRIILWFRDFSERTHFYTVKKGMANALLLIMFTSIFSCMDNENRRLHFDKQSVVDSLLETHRTSPGQYQIKMQAFKAERILEVYLQANNKDWTKVRTYPFCNFSGDLGPKLKEGDRQIPEGIYKIKVFNPKSKFYLSMGLDYPNERDMKIADPDHPGSDIYIHGGCRTVGCIPITDEKIAELYLLAKAARKEIEVLILPYIPTEKNHLKYAEEYPQHQAFWDTLFSDAKGL